MWKGEGCVGEGEGCVMGGGGVCVGWGEECDGWAISYSYPAVSSQLCHWMQKLPHMEKTIPLWDDKENNFESQVLHHL